MRVCVCEYDGDLNGCLLLLFIYFYLVTRGGDDDETTMAVCSGDRNECCTSVYRGTYPGFRLFMCAYSAQGQKNNVTTNWHGRYLL